MLANHWCASVDATIQLRTGCNPLEKHGPQAVLVHADAYLRTVGPAFGLFGMGLVLYFASLGAGHVLGPVLAGTVRLLVVIVGGSWLMAGATPSAQGLFVLVVVAMALYGLCTIASVWRTPWHKK